MARADPRLREGAAQARRRAARAYRGTRGRAGRGPSGAGGRSVIAFGITALAGLVGGALAGYSLGWDRHVNHMADEMIAKAEAKRGAALFLGGSDAGGDAAVR